MSTWHPPFIPVWSCISFIAIKIQQQEREEQQVTVFVGTAASKLFIDQTIDQKSNRYKKLCFKNTNVDCKYTVIRRRYAGR